MRRALAVDAANLVRDRRGMGRLVRGLLRVALQDEGWEVTLLAARRRDRRALAREFPEARVRHPRAAKRRTSGSVAWFPFNGMRYRVRRPAVVTVNDAFAFSEPSAQAIARFREQAPIRRAARRATLLTTISQWSKEQIVARLHVEPERVVVLTVVPDAFFTPGPPETLPLGIEGSRFVLLVGAREERKNARTAIDACAQAFAAPDEQLVVVGTLGAADAARVRELGLRAGEIEASDGVLRALYRRASAVLVPSTAEGFGLVAAEALACGAPVIASCATALPEATRDAAVSLDPLDVVAWSRAIRLMLDDPAHARAYRDRALARYASIPRDSYAREMLALLETVATSSTMSRKRRVKRSGENDSA